MRWLKAGGGIGCQDRRPTSGEDIVLTIEGPAAVHARFLDYYAGSAAATMESPDLRKAISYLGRWGHEISWSQFDEYHRAPKRLEASVGSRHAAPMMSSRDLPSSR